MVSGWIEAERGEGGMQHDSTEQPQSFEATNGASAFQAVPLPARAAGGFQGSVGPCGPPQLYPVMS